MNDSLSARLDGERLRRMRTARGLARADLAAQVGITQSTLTRLETDQVSIDESTLDGLAEALRCRPELLSRPLRADLYTRPWLRAYADANKRDVDRHVADTLLAIEAVEQLGLRRMPDVLPTFRGDLSDAAAIDDFAMTVREAADIEADAPVGNVTRACERLGCVVLPLESELGKHLGMSMYANGVPVIRVAGAGSVPGDRQRFTVAHELAHLTLHADQPPPETAEEAKTIEQQAHRFAGSFLLPGDAFLAHLDELGGRVTLSTLAKLKETWGVAIKAMVVRLQQIGRIDADQARSLYKQISSRDWNKSEPVEVGNEKAIWLHSSAKERLGSDYLDEFAARSLLSSAVIGPWLAWDEPHHAELVDLASRRRSRS
ncbi:XRE family transcriptional regulator [Nocardioides fonticola]|uniref:XRE family transcriptional regulator n=1 Tax=Nocardioides fonticola TaxID=450363 RepID=A0ABP7XSW8_9ACTN